MSEQIHAEKQQNHSRKQELREAQATSDAEQRAQDEAGLARLAEVKQNAIDLVDRIDLLHLDIGYTALFSE